MKQLLLILIYCTSCVLHLLAQTEEIKSPYLFESFKNGIIMYKDGRQFAAPLNYDLVKGKFIFLDVKDDNLEKEFYDPDLIALFRIENRTFLPALDGATEVIQAEPKFYVKYIGITRKAPKGTSYGGETQTASVDNFSSLTGRGVISGVQINNKVLVGIEKIYEVKVGKKTKSFSNEKEFLKIFPSEIRAGLEAYIGNQNLDFTSVEQVLRLFNYAMGNN